MVSVPLPENNDGGRRGFGQGRRDDEPNFEALPDSLPPQNLEAEEAVLGGILLDPDAIGRVACLLYTSPSPRDLSTSRMPSSA